MQKTFKIALVALSLTLLSAPLVLAQGWGTIPLKVAGVDSSGKTVYEPEGYPDGNAYVPTPPWHVGDKVRVNNTALWKVTCNDDGSKCELKRPIGAGTLSLL